MSQADGAPQWFGRPATAVLTGDTVAGRADSQIIRLNDWRQVTLPADAITGGNWRVAVGVYDPQTGQRLPLQLEQAASDGNQGAIGADELMLGAVQVVSPPPADQACALLPATCQLTAN